MPRALQIATSFHAGFSFFFHWQAAQRRHRNDHDGNDSKKPPKKTTDKSPRGYRASLSQSSRNRWHQPMKIRYRKHQPMKTHNMRKITDDPGGTEPSVFFLKTARGVLKQNRRKPKALANENTR